MQQTLRTGYESLTKWQTTLRNPNKDSGKNLRYVALKLSTPESFLSVFISLCLTVVIVLIICVTWLKMRVQHPHFRICSFFATTSLFKTFLVHHTLLGFADIEPQVIVIAPFAKKKKKNALSENVTFSHWKLFVGIIHVNIAIISILPRTTLNTFY